LGNAPEKRDRKSNARLFIFLGLGHIDMNNDRLDLGVIVPPGDDPPIPLNDIIPAYQQSCHCCSGGSDEGDFQRAMIETVNAAPGGVIGDNRAEVVGEDGMVRTVQLTGETRAMIADQATRGDRSMLGEGAVFSDDPVPEPEAAAGYSMQLPGVRDMMESRTTPTRRGKKKSVAFSLGDKHKGIPVWAWIMIVVAIGAVIMKRDMIMQMIQSARDRVMPQTNVYSAPSPMDVVSDASVPMASVGAGMANIIGR
jgi:hypothetical protein